MRTSANPPSRPLVNKGNEKGRSLSPRSSGGVALPLGYSTGAITTAALAPYLKDTDLVPLHGRYRLTTGLRQLAAQTVSLFLGSAHGFFTLPQGYRECLTTLAVGEGQSPFEAFVLLKSVRQDLLSEVAKSFVYLVGRTFQSTHPCVH